MIRFAAGLSGFAALVALTAAPVMADEMADEASYSAYHRAIHAAELCEDRAFDQDDHAKMAQVIDEKIHYALGAGKRLTLIERAKSESGKLIDDEGCGAPAVQESLALFHADLAPALTN
jgi:hypothetical protein